MLATQESNCIQEAHSPLGRGVVVWIVTPGCSLVGVIQEIRPHALSILVKEALVEKSAVSIEFGAVTCEGNIISCRPHESEFEVSIAIPQREGCDVRAAERFPVTEEVQISAGRLDSQLDAVVTDVSTQGIGLEMSAPLETGETVTVESASDVAFGTVRYCRPLRDNRFHAGLAVFHIMPKEPDVSVHHRKLTLLGRLLSSHN
jgi:hypothetical protein